LGERLDRTQEVAGSSPASSIEKPAGHGGFFTALEPYRARRDGRIGILGSATSAAGIGSRYRASLNRRLRARAAPPPPLFARLRQPSYVRRARSGIQAVATSHPASAATKIIARYGTTTPTTYPRFVAHRLLACLVTKITARRRPHSIGRCAHPGQVVDSRRPRTNTSRTPRSLWRHVHHAGTHLERDDFRPSSARGENESREAAPLRLATAAASALVVDRKHGRHDRGPSAAPAFRARTWQRPEPPRSRRSGRLFPPVLEPGARSRVNSSHEPWRGQNRAAALRPSRGGGCLRAIRAAMDKRLEVPPRTVDAGDPDARHMSAWLTEMAPSP
jgi:hypothetical protein